MSRPELHITDTEPEVFDEPMLDDSDRELAPEEDEGVDADEQLDAKRLLAESDGERGALPSEQRDWHRATDRPSEADGGGLNPPTAADGEGRGVDERES